jgi:hypothetical protein
MSKAWYEKPLRIAALQGQAEPLDKMQVPAAWSAMGFNVEQGRHFLRDLPHDLPRDFDPDVHGPVLQQYAEECHQADMYLILYINVHSMPPEVKEAHPEWMQRDREGGFPHLYRTSYACCVNTPWRDHFYAELEATASYDIDGVFLDGPVVVSGGCYCESCQARYRDEYGEDLFEAEDTWDFYRRSRDDFLQEGYDRFHAIKPKGCYYMNLPATHPGASYVDLSEAVKYNDLVGTEGGFMFYGPPKDAYLWKPSVAAKLLEAIAPDKPRVIFMAADQKPWGRYMHTPGETKLCIASTAASAANLWYGPHNSMRYMDTPGGLAAQEIVGFLDEQAAYYEDTASGSRVAVMYSLDTDRAYRKSAEVTDLYGKEDTAREFAGNFTEAYQGVCDILSRNSVPYDLITDLDPAPVDLERYGCLFLPTSACLSDKTIQKIRDYVSAGGHIVASFDTSLYTPAGKRRDDFGLADVLGVSYGEGLLWYQNWNYFSLADDISEEGQRLLDGLELPMYPAPEYVLDVEAAEEAEILAWFHGLMPGRYTPLKEPERPAIVRHRFGQGESLYLAGTFAEMAMAYAPPEYDRLLVNAAEAFDGLPIKLEGGYGNVEVIVRRQQGRLIVHLVNYGGIVPRPFVQVVPQSDLKLRLTKGRDRYEGAQALQANRSCTSMADGQDLVVRVPTIGAYEVVVIE